MDLPNVHVYETQGWPVAYSGNYLRSSMKNYAAAALRFWINFEKPCVFGEAGWDWVHVDPYSDDYTALYHKAGETFGPEDIFHYMYAVFHSPSYRERYAEFLKK